MDRSDFKSAAEYRKWRYHNDPEYRERMKARAREGMRRHYYESEEYRDRYHNNPRFRETLLGWQAENRDRALEYAKRHNRRRYCREDVSNIENYEKALADGFKGWDIHHRLETHRYGDRTRTSWELREDPVGWNTLVALGLYYNRPAKELVFMRKEEHRALHSKKGGAA